MWDDSYYGPPRITASTPCLTCGVKKGKHRGRHPFRPRFANMTDAGTTITGETASVSVGAFTLDVEWAREKGWSERRIIRALDEMEKLALRVGRRAPTRDLDELQKRRRA